MQQIPLGVRILDRAVFESYFPGRNVQAVEYVMQIADGAAAVADLAAPWPRGASGIGLSAANDTTRGSPASNDADSHTRGGSLAALNVGAAVAGDFGAARAYEGGTAGPTSAAGGMPSGAAGTGVRSLAAGGPPGVPRDVSVGTRSVTWLCGPASVGKTHLLQAIVARASQRGRAGYFPLSELAPLGVGVLEGLTALDCICLDDLDQVVGQLDWENNLFALLRETQERDGNLIVAAKAPPALFPWALRDLGSRFAAAAIFQLRELDEEEQQKALQLHAHVRGFELPVDTARWLQRRFPRDMRTLYDLLDTLDEAAMVAQRRLTVPFIRSVLKE